MTGVRREWLSGHGFMRLHLDLIDALGGSWEAAALLDRIMFRSGEDGWWTATLPEIEQECRLSRRKLRRAIQELRDAGMLTSERVSAFDPTLRWRVLYDGEQHVSDETVITAPVGDGTCFTVGDETCFSLSSKNSKEQNPPPNPTAGRVPVLALVPPPPEPQPEPGPEPGLFASSEVEKRATWPAEATANGCRQAWLVAWTEHHGPPDPAIKARAFGAVKQLTKTRGEDLGCWRALWQACHDAGVAGRYDVAPFLAPPPVSRYPQRTNHYVAFAEQAANAGLLDQMLSRPAIGGPA